MARNKYPPAQISVARAVGQLHQTFARLEELEPTMSDEELQFLDQLKAFEDFMYSRVNRKAWLRLTRDRLVLFDDSDFTS